MRGLPRRAIAALSVAAAVIAIGRPAAAEVASRPTRSAAPTAAPPSATLATGRELFANYGCGICHILTDAGAFGDTGPSLDGDPNLTDAFVIARVRDGQDGMPAFGRLLSPQDIAAIAAYVRRAAAR